MSGGAGMHAPAHLLAATCMLPLVRTQCDTRAHTHARTSSSPCLSAAPGLGNRPHWRRPLPPSLPTHSAGHQGWWAHGRLPLALARSLLPRLGLAQRPLRRRLLPLASKQPLGSSTSSTSSQPPSGSPNCLPPPQPTRPSSANPSLRPLSRSSPLNQPRPSRRASLASQLHLASQPPPGRRRPLRLLVEHPACLGQASRSPCRPRCRWLWLLVRPWRRCVHVGA